MKQTLQKNLDDNRNNLHSTEFVLVDFESDDETVTWVTANFQEYLKSGLLRFFECPNLKEWNAPLAKNTVHYLAKGIILVNLDCDNFTGKNGGDMVFNVFNEAENEIVLWQYSKKKLDGSFGRIATTRESFNFIGGYDQSLLPMGFQDGDLRDRLIASGCMMIHNIDSEYNQSIQNEKYSPSNMTWKKMNETNQAKSKLNIKNNQLIANSGKYGIRKGILMLNPNTMLFTDFDKASNH